MGCDERFQRLIDEVLLGDVPATKWERLRTHLRGCEPCRIRYNRVVLAERMLHGGPGSISEPSPSEFDRIAGGLFGARDSRWKRLVQWLAPTPRWATGVAMAAAAVLLIPLLARTPQNARPVEKGTGPVELFQSRGGAPASERQAGLRAFCIHDKVEALDPKGKETPRCERSAQLKLAVSNPGGYKSVFLVGMDDDHAPKWYAPRPPQAESVPAPPMSKDQSEQPVGSAVRLAVNHGPGKVRIFALFSDKPVRAAEVESAVDELARRHVAAGDAEALPLRRPDVLQRSLLVDIQP
jgi:hypothetical protein